MFESLSGRLQAITAKFRGKSRVTDADIKAMMKEIRMALLEADVNYKVVKELVNEIGEKSKGVEVMQSLTPGQQVVKIVNESLTDILGSENQKLTVDPSGFTVVMLYGLQGSGKTTTAAKLGLLLRKKGKKVMMTSVDVHRPAAANNWRYWENPSTFLYSFSRRKRTLRRSRKRLSNMRDICCVTR